MKIRRIYLLVLFTLTFTLKINSQSNVQKFNDLFQKGLSSHLNKNGLFDYNTFSKNELTDSLQKLLSQPGFHADNMQKGTLINIYNALVILKLSKNYPVNSPSDIPGFFEDKDVSFNGENISLNFLEKEMIINIFNDARIHFALVCGAKGCPSLREKIYNDSKIESELEERTKEVINSTIIVLKVDSENQIIYLNELLKWYANDFGFTKGKPSENKSNIISYLNKYRQDTLDSSFEIKYLPYDWRINETELVKDEESANLQQFAPSRLLASEGYEWKMFNSLYTQTAFFDANGENFSQGSRSSFYTTILQYLVGYKGVNIGFEAWIKASRFHSIEDSPVSVLNFRNSELSRWGPTGIGPKIKFQPIKKWSALTVQSTVLLPLLANMEGGEGKAYLSSDTYTWISQIMYDKLLWNGKAQIFTQLSPWIYFNRNNINEKGLGYVSTPYSVFLSHFTTQSFTIYGMGEFWPTWSKEDIISSHFTQAGIGMKYQIIPQRLELELLYQKFLLGKNTGAGQSFNLGMRLIKF